MQKLFKLIRFRNEHPAFDGEFQVQDSADHEVVLSWEKGGQGCRLNVDLKTSEAVIEFTDEAGGEIVYTV